MSAARADLDVARLARLRARFLDATDAAGPVADYWGDDEDLSDYDAVFAVRIGWKWDAVVDELAERGFGRADGQTVVDWGCGTGIAARRFVASLGAGKVVLHDRSARAMAFAARRARDELRCEVATQATFRDLEPDVLLLSHVLDELDARAEIDLLDLVARSARVVWVEPGSRAVSRLLGAHRDRLRGRFHVVAPCPHQEPCGVLADPDDRHWCHFFAKPPVEVFTDGSWARLGRELGIDLRALPYAFVALARDAEDGADGNGVRVLGRPDVGKHEAKFHACAADGLSLRRVGRRAAPELFRALKKHPDRVRRVR